MLGGVHYREERRQAVCSEGAEGPGSSAFSFQFRLPSSIPATSAVNSPQKSSQADGLRNGQRRRIDSATYQFLKP